MFRTIVKNYQSRYLSKTWQQTVQRREMMRNNYHASGDLKKAKTFIKNVAAYSPHTHFVSHGEHVIFSLEG